MRSERDDAPEKSDSTQERIIAAAVWHGVTFSLPAPARHHEILAVVSATLEMDAMRIGTPERQGFLTNTGRFVGRVEAYSIAHRAKQVIGVGRPPELFSEDVW